MVQQLTDLPLGVARISPAGRGFSYCALPQDAVEFENSTKQIQDCVLEFEYSALWPRDSDAAVKVLEGSFLLQIATALSKQFNLPAHVGDERYVARGSEAPSQDVATFRGFSHPFLDVVFPRYIFRIRVFSPFLQSIKEQAHFLTFDAQLKGNMVEKLLSCTEAANRGAGGQELFGAVTTSNPGTADEEGSSAEERLLASSAMWALKFLWWKPRTRKGFHNLATEYPAFSATVKLVFQWLDSQSLLDSNEDFAEHLVAFLFSRTNNVFTSIPTTAKVGLARFLYVLTHQKLFFDGEAPLVLQDCFFGARSDEDFLGLERPAAADDTKISSEKDVNNKESARGSLSESQLQLLQESFERRKKPNFPLFAVCSRYDPHGLFCSCPSPVSLKLLAQRAELALTALEKRQTGDCAEEGGAFGGLPSFDVQVVFKGLKKKSAQKGPLHHAHFSDLESEVVVRCMESFAAETRQKFGAAAAVYLSYREKRVGLAWRQAAFRPHQPSRALMHRSCPYKKFGDGGERMILPDTEDIVRELKVMLDGMDVEVITG